MLQSCVDAGKALQPDVTGSDLPWHFVDADKASQPHASGVKVMQPHKVTDKVLQAHVITARYCAQASLRHLVAVDGW